MSRKIDFSEIIALVSRGEKAHSRFQWELGDALLKAIGKPNRDGSQDGSFPKFEACSEELKLHGYEYEASTLRSLRTVAAKFPPDLRKSGVSWVAHHLAGSPEMLDTVIASAPRNQKITQTYVSTVMRAMVLEQQQKLEKENERRRDAYEEARLDREAAQEAEKRAGSAAERKAAAGRAADAARRQRQNFTPAKMRDLPPSPKPKPEDMPLLLTRAAFVRDVAVIRLAVSKLRKNYETVIPSFPDADAENGHDELMAIAEEARTLAGLFKQQIGKTSHLSVVKDAG